MKKYPKSCMYKNQLLRVNNFASYLYSSIVCFLSLTHGYLNTCLGNRVADACQLKCRYASVPTYL